MASIEEAKRAAYEAIDSFRETVDQATTEKVVMTKWQALELLQILDRLVGLLPSK